MNVWSLLPPEDIFTRMAPIICRVVGIAFIAGAIAGFIFVPVFLFRDQSNTTLIAFVLLGASVFNLITGIVAMIFLPRFMLSGFREFRKLTGPFHEREKDDAEQRGGG
jgi:hypothetical protein